MPRRNRSTIQNVEVSIDPGNDDKHRSTLPSPVSVEEWSASWPHDLDPEMPHNFHESLADSLFLPSSDDDEEQPCTSSSSLSPPQWTGTKLYDVLTCNTNDSTTTEDAIVVPFDCLSPEEDTYCSGFDPCNVEEMSEVYSKGMLPYVMGRMSKRRHDDSHNNNNNNSTTLESQWNGHLPLAPMPSTAATDDEQVPRGRPNTRRRRPRREIGKLSLVQSTIIPATMLSPNEIELLLNDGDSKSDANKRGGADLHRAPRPTESLSLPAAAAAAKQQKVKAPAASSPMDVEESNAPPNALPGVEYVHVQPRGSPRSALKDLPPLRDAPPNKKEELFIQKLQLCGVIFSFDDPTSDKRGKDMKRQTLLELVDYVNTPAGQKIFTESVMADLMAMVSANVCRALPPATDDFDPEEDEPVLEPAWPHLQVAYEFFLRFIVSSEVGAKVAKKYVDQTFCLQLVELFDSEDPRERDYLKTILHRIYGKFMSHRSFIRRAISNVFYRFVYETERHNGIGELLEILGSIINGFAIPLKKEHLQFLVRALIPLHKPKCVALYHQQLSYCIIQYVEKDADTATPILEGFFKCWPWSCSGKQVMFLNELEEILELLGPDQLAQSSQTLFTNLARCLDSDHFQVVERALFLWNNEHLVNSGCLSRLNAQTVLPLIYGPLYKNSSGHWNATVEGLAQNVLKMYMEYDLVLYDKCTAAYFRQEEEAKRKLEALEERWNSIEQEAHSKMQASSAMMVSASG